MLTFHMRSAFRDEGFDRLPEFLRGLGDAFSPVLEPAMDSQAASLGLDSRTLLPMKAASQAGRRSISFSEVLAVDGGLIGIQVRDIPRLAMRAEGVKQGQTRQGLTLFGLGAAEVEASLEAFVALVSEQFSVEIESFKYESERFKALKEEGMTPPAAPSGDEVAASRLLAVDLVRRAVIAVASSGGLLARDLVKQIPVEDRQDGSENLVEDLLATGIVTSDLVLVCSKTSEQVLRVPDQEALDKAADAGVCCACGAPVAEESAEVALSLTALGRKLLDGSWWMTVLLMEELARLGVDREAMLVEENVGGEEVDCFADISGALVIFELKDKEFSLGNAFSFGSKFPIYRPSHSVVVTTAQVGKDARDHFEKAFSARGQGSGTDTTTIEYIEGLNNLRSGLESLVGGIFEADGAALLRATLPSAAIDPVSLAAAVSSSTTATEHQLQGDRSSPDVDKGVTDASKSEA